MEGVSFVLCIPLTICVKQDALDRHLFSLISLSSSSEWLDLSHVTSHRDHTQISNGRDSHMTNSHRMFQRASHHRKPGCKAGMNMNDAVQWNVVTVIYGS
ncbi:hypothetical protein BaRGS_00010543 [Batillaria attramentaria]|uniref:Secreted protein n=1 Tax=Batillaria attramentaria TaxID=370345 RepID=A0ABD0LGB6_9CAEN